MRVRVRSLLVTNWVFFRFAVGSQWQALKSPFLSAQRRQLQAEGLDRRTWGPQAQILTLMLTLHVA